MRKRKERHLPQDELRQVPLAKWEGCVSRHQRDSKDLHIIFQNLMIAQHFFNDGAFYKFDQWFLQGIQWTGDLDFQRLHSVHQFYGAVQ